MRKFLVSLKLSKIDENNDNEIKKEAVRSYPGLYTCHEKDWIRKIKYPYLNTRRYYANHSNHLRKQFVFDQIMHRNGQLTRNLPIRLMQTLSEYNVMEQTDFIEFDSLGCLLASVTVTGNLYIYDFDEVFNQIRIYNNKRGESMNDSIELNECDKEEANDDMKENKEVKPPNNVERKQQEYVDIYPIIALSLGKAVSMLKWNPQNEAEIIVAFRYSYGIHIINLEDPEPLVNFRSFDTHKNRSGITCFEYIKHLKKQYFNLEYDELKNNINKGGLFREYIISASKDGNLCGWLMNNGSNRPNWIVSLKANVVDILILNIIPNYKNKHDESKNLERILSHNTNDNNGLGKNLSSGYIVSITEDSRLQIWNTNILKCSPLMRIASPKLLYDFYLTFKPKKLYRHPKDLTVILIEGYHNGLYTLNIHSGDIFSINDSFKEYAIPLQDPTNSGIVNSNNLTTNSHGEMILPIIRFWRSSINKFLNIFTTSGEMEMKQLKHYDLSDLNLKYVMSYMTKENKKLAPIRTGISTRCLYRKHYKKKAYRLVSSKTCDFIIKLKIKNNLVDGQRYIEFADDCKRYFVSKIHTSSYPGRTSSFQIYSKGKYYKYDIDHIVKEGNKIEISPPWKEYKRKINQQKKFRTIHFHLKLKAVYDRLEYEQEKEQEEQDEREKKEQKQANELEVDQSMYNKENHENEHPNKRQKLDDDNVSNLKNNNDEVDLDYRNISNPMKVTECKQQVECITWHPSAPYLIIGLKNVGLTIMGNDI